MQQQQQQQQPQNNRFFSSWFGNKTTNQTISYREIELALQNLISGIRFKDNITINTSKKVLKGISKSDILGSYIREKYGNTLDPTNPTRSILENPDVKEVVRGSFFSFFGGRQRTRKQYKKLKPKRRSGTQRYR